MVDNIDDFYENESWKDFFAWEYRKRKFLVENGTEPLLNEIKYILSSLDDSPKRLSDKEVALDLSRVRKLIDSAIGENIGFYHYAQKDDLIFYEIVKLKCEHDEKLKKYFERIVHLSIEYGIFICDCLDLHNFYVDIDYLKSGKILMPKHSPLLKRPEDIYNHIDKYEDDDNDIIFFHMNNDNSVLSSDSTISNKLKDRFILSIDVKNFKEIHFDKIKELIYFVKYINLPDPDDGFIDDDEDAMYKYVINKMKSLDKSKYRDTKKAQRLIGLALWDAVHLSNKKLPDVIKELRESCYISRHLTKCERNQNECSTCIDTDECKKDLSDYYHGTQDCIEAGNVLSLIHKRNKRNKETT